MPSHYYDEDPLTFRNLKNVGVASGGPAGGNFSTDFLKGLSFNKPTNVQIPGQGGEGLGLNQGTLGAVSAGIGGLGSLAQGWAALKGVGVAEDQLAQNRDIFERNFGQQQKAYQANIVQTNNRIRDQNAWKTAQGRTDLAKLVV